MYTINVFPTEDSIIDDAPSHTIRITDIKGTFINDAVVLSYWQSRFIEAVEVTISYS